MTKKFILRLLYINKCDKTLQLNFEKPNIIHVDHIPHVFQSSSYHNLKKNIKCLIETLKSKVWNITHAGLIVDKYIFLLKISFHTQESTCLSILNDIL